MVSTTAQGLSVVDHYTFDKVAGGCADVHAVSKVNHSNTKSGPVYGCTPSVQHPR